MKTDKLIFYISLTWWIAAWARYDRGLDFQYQMGMAIFTMLGAIYLKPTDRSK